MDIRKDIRETILGNTNPDWVTWGGVPSFIRTIIITGSGIYITDKLDLEIK